MVVADRVKELRTQRLALTQRELATALNIESVNVSRWERGVSEPRLAHLRALAALAGVPVSWFFEDAA